MICSKYTIEGEMYKSYDYYVIGDFIEKRIYNIMKHFPRINDKINDYVTLKTRN